ncbi:MAG TPA: HlyD family secretion protein [Candidatus Acidoferrales bacterium]|nr:HlyD family secretion protein [Candidatus Acidoferrales bacterium]
MESDPRESLESRIRALHDQGARLEEELATLRRRREDNGDDGSIAADERPANGRLAERTPRRAGGLRRALSRLAIILLAAIVAGAGVQLWNYLDTYESTDDAQIDGHIAPISARVAGMISHVYVQDTEQVKVGELIAEIDPRDAQVAVANARANLAQAAAQVESARADYTAALSRIRQAEAENEQAQKDADRFEQLYGQHIVSGSQYDDKMRAAEVDDAAVESDRASANAARTLIASREAAVKSAQAALDQALLNLEYTRIVAPMNGVVGHKTVEVGQQVQPGQQMLAIVPLDDIWITANFKETQIHRMKPGQRVTIYVDALGREYRGYVEGMGGASGEKYSLLPPENATGNYVKVVQRLPIRIRLEPGQNQDHRLWPGMSVVPKVWLR